MTSWSYENVGDELDALQIAGITVDPDPPTRGQALTASIAATAQDTIVDGAWLDVEVRLGGIKLDLKRYDLFQKLKGDDSDGWTLMRDTGASDAPIEKGDTPLTFAMNIPRGTPGGRFTIRVRAFTAADDPLCALNFEVNFRF